jgi:hypothetical protein
MSSTSASPNVLLFKSSPTPSATPSPSRLEHDIREYFPEKLENVSIDLLKLQQERIVPFSAVDPSQPWVRNPGRELQLFFEGKKTSDANNWRRLLDLW